MFIPMSRSRAAGTFLSPNLSQREVFIRVTPVLAAFMFVTALSVSAQNSAPKQEKSVTRPALRYDDTDLTAAARVGDAKKVASLADQGADINETNGDGRTPLMVAAAGGHVETLRVLIARKAEINMTDRDGMTALMRAVETSAQAAVALLVEQGADVNQKDDAGYTALLYAAVVGHAGIAELLLQGGANINALDRGGDTALVGAIVNQRVDVANVLLKHGANPDLKDQFGSSAKDYAQDSPSPAIRRLFAAPQTPAAGVQPVSLAQKGIRAAIIANTFRLEAFKNVMDAVNRWGTVSFVAHWNRDIGKVFGAPGRQPMLREFFGTAIVFVGSVQDDDVVVGLYNPWHDALLLMRLLAKDDSFIMADFRFIHGETWRNEKVTTADDLLRLYALQEPLVLALARNYAATAKTFSDLYPPEGTQGFLPKVLADRLDIPDDELKPIVARMLYRTKMFTALVAPPNRQAFATLKTLAERIRAGDETALRTALAPSQNLDMVTSICRLPADIRADFGPAYFGQGDGALLALTSPLHPRWVIAAQVSPGVAGENTVKVELVDLESSEALVKLAEGRKP